MDEQIKAVAEEAQAIVTRADVPTSDAIFLVADRLATSEHRAVRAVGTALLHIAVEGRRIVASGEDASPERVRQAQVASRNDLAGLTDEELAQSYLVCEAMVQTMIGAGARVVEVLFNRAREAGNEDHPERSPASVAIVMVAREFGDDSIMSSFLKGPSRRGGTL